MKKKGSATVVVLGFVALLAVAAGFFVWQSERTPSAQMPAPSSDRVTVGQISFISSSTLFTLSTTTLTVSDMFKAPDMASYSADCGTNKPESYFRGLLAKFPASESAVKYDFNYIGENENGTFNAEVLPNVFGYKTLSDFQKDFNRCNADDVFYPVALNDSYLLFEGGCGGVAPDGCTPVRSFVGPTIKLGN